MFGFYKKGYFFSFFTTPILERFANFYNKIKSLKEGGKRARGYLEKRKGGKKTWQK